MVINARFPYFGKYSVYLMLKKRKQKEQEARAKKYRSARDTPGT